MRSITRLLAVILLAALALCCRPPAPAPPSAPLAVHVYREFSRTMHVDTGFPDGARALLVKAADKWRKFTNGHVDIQITFDVDFESVEDIRLHRDATHDLILAIAAPTSLTDAIDKGFAPYVPLAATAELKNGANAVFMIMNRITKDHFLSVSMHEMGHVIGLPDLEEMGAVMSGVELRGQPVPEEFTPTDRDLCRLAKYCD